MTQPEIAPQLRAHKLIMRLLTFELECAPDADEAGREARQLLLDLAAEFADDKLVLASTDHFYLVPRGGWVYFSHSRYAQNCIECGERIKIGTPVYWREDDPRVALCDGCGQANTELRRRLHRAVPQKELFP